MRRIVVNIKIGLTRMRSLYNKIVNPLYDRFFFFWKKKFNNC